MARLRTQTGKSSRDIFVVRETRELKIVSSRDGVIYYLVKDRHHLLSTLSSVRRAGYTSDMTVAKKSSQAAHKHQNNLLMTWATRLAFLSVVLATFIWLDGIKVRLI